MFHSGIVAITIAEVSGFNQFNLGGFPASLDVQSLLIDLLVLAVVNLLPKHFQAHFGLVLVGAPIRGNLYYGFCHISHNPIIEQIRYHDTGNCN